MGTHPIFESDFDCLTEMGESSDISLKVMRISRPMFQPEAPIHAEEDDLIYSTGSTNYSGLSNSLLIPNSVGDFYLGEPANFMVTVQNLCVSKDEMSNVLNLKLFILKLTVDIQKKFRCSAKSLMIQL